MSSEWDRRLPLRPADPRVIPEHHLWTLAKDGSRAEARTRMVPIGLGRPELRLYVSSRETGEMMFLWSQVFEDGRQVCELAEAKKKEFEAKGWREDGCRIENRPALASRVEHADEFDQFGSSRPWRN
jgi:hypothetical protein